MDMNELDIIGCVVLNNLIWFSDV